MSGLDRAPVRSRRKARLGSVIASVLAGSMILALAYVLPARSQTTAFTCRASAVRVEDANGQTVLEPITANAQDNPCVSENGSLVGPTDLAGLGTARVLYAQTCAPGDATCAAQPTSQAGVAKVTLDAAGTPVTATVLSSEANVTCSGTNPAFSSSSTVATVTVNGTPVVDVSQPQTIDVAGLATLYLNREITTANSVTRRALELDVPGVGNVIVGESVADTEGNPCANGGSSSSTGGSSSSTGAPAARRWMTGGGKLGVEAAGVFVTHGFTLNCVPNSPPTNMVVSWRDTSGHHSFQLATVDSATCDMDGVPPNPPAADFNRYQGSGTGRCDRGPAQARWTYTDHGEPGTLDTAEIHISGSCTLDVPMSPAGGNHQAHQTPQR